LIALTRTATGPDHPAGRDTLSPAGRGSALRVLLRPSATVCALLAVSLVVASAALWTALAPLLGGWRAVPPTLAFAAAGMLGALAWRRAQPRVIEIGPDCIRAFTRDGVSIASGPLTAGSQWGASLLLLTVGTAARRRTLLIASDALPAASFRALAVRARCAAGH